MSVELQADLAEVSTARRFVRANLPDVPDAVSADAQLITSEMVTNAIEHGVGGPVIVVVSRREHFVALTVESVGPAPGVGAVDEWKLAAADEITGRGLAIVRAIADDVEVIRSPGRLVITATLAV